MAFEQLLTSYDGLMGEYKKLTEAPSNETYEEFGWKCMDFVGGIMEAKQYVSEQRVKIIEKLKSLRELALNLKPLKDYIDQVIGKVSAPQAQETVASSVASNDIASLLKKPNSN